MISATSTLPPSTATLPSATPSPAASGNPTQGLTQNDFLNLLTAQLQHQDPLNPMTGAEFAAELAEFSTASGVQGLQTGLSGLNATLTGVQATGLVGHQVAVPGASLTLGSTGAVGAVNLAAAASDVTVKIADATGKTVATLDLGPMAAGVQTFTWSGAADGGSQLAAGSYQIGVSAVGANGAAVPVTPDAIVPVVAVALGGQSGPMLDLGGGFAPVALSAVQQVY